jgi:hypothetical protein
MLTDQEMKIVNDLGNIWDEILKLPVYHTADNSEACRDIHNLQNRIMARDATRDHGWEKAYVNAEPCSPSIG